MPEDQEKARALEEKAGAAQERADQAKVKADEAQARADALREEASAMGSGDEAAARRVREQVRLEEAQRKHKRQQLAQQSKEQMSPPPFEVPETTLEGLGPGFGYLGAVIGGSFLLNLALIAILAAANGG